jgi:hypothetical protein
MLYLGVLYNSQRQQGVIWLNNCKTIIFVMVKCRVLFEVRTEFLNIV